MSDQNSCPAGWVKDFSKVTPGKTNTLITRSLSTIWWWKRKFEEDSHAHISSTFYVQHQQQQNAISCFLLAFNEQHATLAFPDANLAQGKEIAWHWASEKQFRSCRDFSVLYYFVWSEVCNSTKDENGLSCHCFFFFSFFSVWRVKGKLGIRSLTSYVASLHQCTCFYMQFSPNRNKHSITNEKTVTPEFLQVRLIYTSRQ